MTRRPRVSPSAFRPSHHNVRVRMGVTGPQGVLLRCRTRDRQRWYWKVLLDQAIDGDRWAWPDGGRARGLARLPPLILEGPGTQVGHCIECGLPTFAPLEGDPVMCTGCTTREGGLDPTDANLGRARARRDWRSSPHGERRDTT